MKHRIQLKSKLGERLYNARRAECNRNYRLRKKVKEEQRQLSRRPPPSPQPPTHIQQEEKDFRVTAEEDLGNECVDLNGDESEHIVFRHPFTCIVSAPSKAGKTYWTRKLIKNREDCIQPNVERIVWCYGAQGAVTEVKKEFPFVEFKDGLPTEDWLKSLDPNVNVLLLIDDLMHLSKNGVVAKLFTEYSHHNNISCVFIVQNIYAKQKDMRDASLNTTYRVIFDNPADKRQLCTLSSSVFGNGNGHYISDILADIKKDTTYGYLLLDLHPRTNEMMRVRSAVFPGEENDVYISSTQLFSGH